MVLISFTPLVASSVGPAGVSSDEASRGEEEAQSQGQERQHCAPNRKAMRPAIATGYRPTHDAAQQAHRAYHESNRADPGEKEAQ
jgi:hypothetical protein